jgi:hypothetical protein
MFLSRVLLKAWSVTIVLLNRLPVCFGHEACLAAASSGYPSWCAFRGLAHAEGVVPAAALCKGVGVISQRGS